MAITQIPAEFIPVNAISGTIIADNAVTAIHIATNAISGTLIADNAVTAVHIATNAITGTLIADNAVTAVHVAGSSITATQIQDNAIGTGQLAGIARGKIIYGDSSGDPQLLTLGSNGQVLKSDGTDISWGSISTPITALNSATENELVTIGSTTTELNAESGLTWDTTTLTVNGAAVFNESSADVDFRIESNNNANMLFVDGGNDRIGIGEGSPDVPLHITEAGSDGYETLFKMERSHASGDEVGVEWHLTGSGGTAQAAGIFAWKGEDFSGSTSRSAGLTLTCKENGTDQFMYQLGTFSDGVTGHKWLTQGAQRMCISHAGYVGIGTTSPSHDLEVEATSPSITIDKGAAGYGTLRFYSGGAQKAYIQCDADEDMYYYAGSGTDSIFYSHGLELMRMQAGKIGIGTSSIDSNIKLQIEDSTYPTIAIDRSSSLVDGNHLGYINFQNNGDVYGRIGCWVESASGTDGTLRFGTQNATSMTDKMVIMSDGKVGIGTEAPSYRQLTINSSSGDVGICFEVGGTRYWNTTVDTGGSPGSNSYWIGDAQDDNGVYIGQGGSSWSGISDERLKRNWTNITGATDKIDTLTKVGTFERRGKTTGTWSSDKELGLSAQEVEAILPEAVTTGGDVEFGEGDTVTEIKGMSYDKLVPLLVKAIQELNTRLKAVE